LALALFAGMAAARKCLHPVTCSRGRIALARLAFAALVLASALLTSCESGYYTNIIKPAQSSGSQVGNYTIVIVGTLGGGSSEVNRTATVNLAVT
jgi:hypothetical protein